MVQMMNGTFSADIARVMRLKNVRKSSTWSIFTFFNLKKNINCAQSLKIEENNQGGQNEILLSSIHSQITFCKTMHLKKGGEGRGMTTKSVIFIGQIL